MLVARLTEPARHDLSRIGIHIALSSRRPELSDRIIDELMDEFERLALLSESVSVGKLVPQIGAYVGLSRLNDG